MKKNSIGFLVTLVALSISGCNSSPKKKARRSSIVDDSSELVSSSQESSSESSIGTSFGTSIGTSVGTSVGSSEHSEAALSSHIVTSTTPYSSVTPVTSSTYISSLTPVVSSQTPYISSSTYHSSSVYPQSSSATPYPSSSTPVTSSSTPAPLDPYYKDCEGLSGSSLEAKLKSINQPKNPSYDWYRYEEADEAEDDPTSILSLYTRHNIKKSNHCGNYSWTTWNREHIWTQTKYPASKTDNHNIFACEGQINGYRSDKPFAEGGQTVVVFDHTTGCKQTDSTFEPCDEAKGEVARSVMYGTVMYSYTMTLEIESVYLALKWHLEHPITTRETTRNEVVYGNQGNRNPFVDHPEFACRIWGSTNSQTKSLCGM